MPETRINAGFPKHFCLLELVSQEFYSDNFNSAFAILGRYIRHIRRHIFYCHKNCEYSGQFYTVIPEVGNRRSDVKETVIPEPWKPWFLPL